MESPREISAHDSMHHLTIHGHIGQECAYHFPGGGEGRERCKIALEKYSRLFHEGSDAERVLVVLMRQ